MMCPWKAQRVRSRVFTTQAWELHFCFSSLSHKCYLPVLNCGPSAAKTEAATRLSPRPFKTGFMEQTLTKLSYFLWSALRFPLADAACPGCHGQNTYLLHRKYLVTALYRCRDCMLMFRVPKGDPEQSARFYQSAYNEGFTTDCPSREQLQAFLECGFAGTEKEYSTYIKVLQAAGVRPGMRVLDFGCSWGYGSWQLRKAGYEVLSYEVSNPRARYAETMLGCALAEPAKLDGTIDCFFSAHVLEHFDRPRDLWKLAYRTLKPDGIVATFVPNGCLDRKEVHSIWGHVHPLLIDADGLRAMAASCGFTGRCYSLPYNLAEIQSGSSGSSLRGDELVIIAQKIASFALC